MAFGGANLRYLVVPICGIWLCQFVVFGGVNLARGV